MNDLLKLSSDLAVSAATVQEAPGSIGMTFQVGPGGQARAAAAGDPFFDVASASYTVGGFTNPLKPAQR